MEFLEFILWATEYCILSDCFSSGMVLHRSGSWKNGFKAAAERFLKMMAMVWAGSQVTKLFRAAGLSLQNKSFSSRALALAPFVDRGLSWFTVKLMFQSQGKAFFTIVGFCLGLAVALFLIVTLLSAWRMGHSICCYVLL